MYRPRDCDIRLALEAELKRLYDNDPHTLIRHEMGICAGKRRIDVAVINGELTGYEIKSDLDTLTRLADQVNVYSDVFDKAVLVTTDRHLDNALPMLPNWWGITVARTDRDKVVLEEHRQPELNDRHDAFSIAQLLWKDEALDVLRQRGMGRGLSKSLRYYVWATLADALSVNELRCIVRDRLRARPQWPGGQLREQGDVNLRTTAS